MDNLGSDPYYTAQSEILKAVIRAKETYHGCHAQGFHSRQASRGEELRAELEQILYDLDDVSATIDAVENNPTKFAVSLEQLNKRKHFVSSTREAVRDIQKNLRTSTRHGHPSGDQSSGEPAHAQNRYFLAAQAEQKQAIYQQQDDQLEALAVSADRLHHTAVVINEELEDQQRMLIELDQDIDREAERMNFVMKRMARILKTSDTKQLCLILWLVGVAAFLTFLVIAL